jgi:phosphate transport system substrate-binding protein
MASGDSGNASPQSGRKYGAATITGAIVSTVLALAVFLVTFYIKVTPPAARSPSPTSTATAQTVSCASGSLELAGSTAFLPIAQAAANVYMSDCPGAAITVSGGESAFGLAELGRAAASHPLAAGSIIAMYDGLPPAADAAGLEQYPIGVLILSVVAHTGLFPGSNISAGELRKIFTQPGEAGIVAAGLQAGSGTRQAFFANVLGLSPSSPEETSCPPPAGLTGCTEDSNVGLLSFVNETANAVGYAEVLQPATGYANVSVISIDGIAPTPANVLDGTYGFWMVEHLYTAAHPSTLAKEFLDFLPHYIESNPSRGLIGCSSAVKGFQDC